MRINLKYFANPFFCYSGAFLISLFIYSWGWSDMYPAISIGLFFFLLLTVSVSLFLGFKYGDLFVYYNIKESNNNEIFVLFIVFTNLLELLYNGSIPILNIISGLDYDYMDYGIPTFHVFNHTLTNYLGIYFFHQFLSFKNRKILLYALMPLIIDVIILNRGAAVMSLIGFLILYLSYKSTISVKSILRIFLLFFAFFYFFGVIGNLRSFKDTENLLLDLTKATDNFKNSVIPNEYYWFYLYASSPVANLQTAIEVKSQHNYNLFSYINSELLPDFLSKRISDPKLDEEHISRMDNAVSPILTVGTIYFDSYIRMGFWGLFITFVYFIFFLSLYTRMFPAKDTYFLSAVIVLCLLSVFSVFDNMIKFSGLFLQLLYPYIFSLLDLKKIKIIIPKIRIK